MLLCFAGVVADHLNRQLLVLSKLGVTQQHPVWMTGPLRVSFEHLIEGLAESWLVNRSAVHGLWQDLLRDPTGRTWPRAWTLGVLVAWLNASG